MNLEPALYTLGTKFSHKSTNEEFMRIIGVNVDSDTYTLRFSAETDVDIVMPFDELNALVNAGAYAPITTVRNTALRYNTNKPQLSFLPKLACEEEARVWAFGAGKYGRDNWRKLWGERTIDVALDSALRHLLAIGNGELIDTESGLSHAAHVRCNMAMIIEYQMKKDIK